MLSTVLYYELAMKVPIPVGITVYLLTWGLGHLRCLVIDRPGLVLVQGVSRRVMPPSGNNLGCSTMVNYRGGCPAGAVSWQRSRLAERRPPRVPPHGTSGLFNLRSLGCLTRLLLGQQPGYCYC